MKEINLYSKILHNGGVYDTKNYRYRINRNGNIERCKLEYIGVIVPLHFEAWQPYNKAYQDLF